MIRFPVKAWKRTCTGKLPSERKQESSFKEIVWIVQCIEFLGQACNAFGKKILRYVVRRVHPPITKPCTKKICKQFQMVFQHYPDLGLKTETYD